MSDIPFGRIFNSEPPWCQNTPVALTGSTDETELAKILLPGKYMGPNGDMTIAFIFKSTAVDDQTLTLSLGNEDDPHELFTVTVAAAATVGHRIVLTNRDDPAAQIAMVDGAAASAALTIDTSQDMVLTVTGLLVDDTDTLTLEKITVETLFRY